jgi:HD-like signal output (HDOD) protein
MPLPTDEETRRRLKRIVQHGVTLPPMSAVGAELMEMNSTPIADLNTRKVADLIEHDPAITARVMRIANSSYYGLPGEVTSVMRAVTLIGLEEIRGVVTYYSLTSAWPEDINTQVFSSKQFWVHSWTCGTAARQIASPRYLVTTLPGEAFLAGLLHDVGKILLAMRMPKEFAQACDLAKLENIPLNQAEKRTVGLDHAMLGAYLLQEWKLPDAILEAVAAHHDPAAATEEHQEGAAVTELADLMANHYGIRGIGAPIQYDLGGSWFALHTSSPLGQEAACRQVIREVCEELQEKSEFLSAGEAKEAPPDEAEDETAEEESQEEKAPREEPVEPPQPPETPAREPNRTIWSRMAGRIGSLFGGKSAAPKR